MPLGKRNNRWPPYTIERESKFWEREPSARPLAHGAARIASLVEQCAIDLLDDFQIPRPQVPRLHVTFHPYMNFVASRPRLQTRPLHTWRTVRDRLMSSACLRIPNSSDCSVPDNPQFSKIHASVMEMLQDAIFGRMPITGPRNHTWLPANQSDCEPERRPRRHVGGGAGD